MLDLDAPKLADSRQQKITVAGFELEGVSIAGQVGAKCMRGAYRSDPWKWALLLDALLACGCRIIKEAVAHPCNRGTHVDYVHVCLHGAVAWPGFR